MEFNADCRVRPLLTLQYAAMSDHPQIDQITERVERLLVRYEELQRTNALQHDQIATLTHERDSLKSRLGAARARVDALIERLPALTEAQAKESRP